MMIAGSARFIRRLQLFHFGVFCLNVLNEVFFRTQVSDGFMIFSCPERNPMHTFTVGDERQSANASHCW